MVFVSLLVFYLCSDCCDYFDGEYGGDVFFLGYGGGGFIGNEYGGVGSDG